MMPLSKRILECGHEYITSHEVLENSTALCTVPECRRWGKFKPKAKRGFALLTPEQRREIAGRGGKRGRGHKFTTEEAREAGRKGGDSVSRDTAYMAEIGRRGGQARRKVKA